MSEEIVEEAQKATSRRRSTPAKKVEESTEENTQEIHIQEVKEESNSKEEVTQESAFEDVEATDKGSCESDTVSEEEEQEPLSAEERMYITNDIVKNHMMAAMGLGVVPIPLVDVAGIAAIQLNMIRKLCSVYELEFKKDLGKSFVGALLGGSVSIPLAMGLSSFVKFVPVIGHTAGTVSLTMTSAATTYAVGRVFIQHFESGGDLLDFKPKEMRAFFKEKLQEGKNLAKEFKSTFAKEKKDKDASA